jgi:hypothetical protein
MAWLWIIGAIWLVCGLIIAYPMLVVVPGLIWFTWWVLTDVSALLGVLLIVFVGLGLLGQSQ